MKALTAEEIRKRKTPFFASRDMDSIIKEVEGLPNAAEIMPYIGIAVNSTLDALANSLED